MVDAAAQYQRALKKKLRCGTAAKGRLLEKFSVAVAAYTEEHDDATMDDLSAAFGPPEEMAVTLMKEVTEQEKKQYRKTTLYLRIFVSVLLALFIVFTVWLYFFKEVGLTYNDGADVTDRATETTSLIDDRNELP